MRRLLLVLLGVGAVLAYRKRRLDAADRQYPEIAGAHIAGAQ